MLLLLRMIVERKYDVSNVEKILLLDHAVIEVIGENDSNFIIDNLIFINTKYFNKYQEAPIRVEI